MFVESLGYDHSMLMHMEREVSKEPLSFLEQGSERIGKMFNGKFSTMPTTSPGVWHGLTGNSSFAYVHNS